MKQLQKERTEAYKDEEIGSSEAFYVEKEGRNSKVLLVKNQCTCMCERCPYIGYPNRAREQIRRPWNHQTVILQSLSHPKAPWLVHTLDEVIRRHLVAAVKCHPFRIQLPHYILLDKRCV